MLIGVYRIHDNDTGEALNTAQHYLAVLREEWPEDSFTLVKRGNSYEIHNTTRSKQR